MDTYANMLFADGRSFMRKRILSVLLSLVLVFASLVPAFSVSAASYKDELIKAGFPEDYAVKLAELHTKYPNWKFVPLKTGLTFDEAVSGERSSHGNQILESGWKAKYYCTCSKCKGKNIASEYAVRYFMDPRNWLDESHIFQFEDNRYNSAHNTAGVEKILAGTFMKDSVITYINTEGNKVTYKNSNGSTVKYSKAIMESAKSANISAYYIASRIVKEIGTTNTNNVIGVAGNRSPFTGIYNFYSIGAGNGAMAGLEWAAGWLKTNKATKLYAKYDSAKKAGTGNVTNLKADQYMVHIATYGDYYKVRLYKVSGKTYTAGSVGYVLKSALRTTYFNYYRPWNDPYKSIIGGANYIARGYLDYQYTSYLEKFNVNRSSNRLFSHEYMQNVDAPSVESVKRYNAYVASNQISNAKTFYIPVFTKMDASTTAASSTAASSATSTAAAATTAAQNTTQVQKLTLVAANPTNIQIKWNAVSGAKKYYIRIKNLTKGTTFSKTVETNSAQLNNLTNGHQYQIEVRANVGGKWAQYSAKLVQRCLPKTVTLSSVKSPASRQVKATWKKAAGAAGYQVWISTDKNFKKNVIKKSVSADKLTKTVKELKSGKVYYVKVRAYTKLKDKKFYGKFSKVKQIKAK